MTSTYPSILRNLGYLFVLTMILGLQIHAQTENNSAQLQPIASILAEDGSLIPSNNGSFDPAGYQLVTGKNGEPRFVSTDTLASCDAWNTQFSINGTDGTIRAVVADGLGNVYIGGNFSLVGGVRANRVAKWNGTEWSALGSGLSGGNVLAIAVSGNDVYVGGGFSSAGGIPASKVAKWNGTEWSALGVGISSNQGLGWVETLAVLGGNLYAGGSFYAGTGDPDRIARWDGTSWSSVGSGMNDDVLALLAHNGEIYAGGRFTTAGGVDASRIARWNGSEWSAIGSGVSGRVQAIAASGSNIYVGGAFGTATGNNVARWNGSTWESLGTGIGDAPIGYTPVISLAVDGSNVYVGGSFLSAGGNNGIQRIARWNGTSWSSLGSGVGDVTAQVFGLATRNGELVVGGNFQTAGTSNAGNFATWNGSSWSAGSGTALTGPVRAIAVSGTDVYIGGTFTAAGSTPANRIVKWDGTTWTALGNGFPGTSAAVNAIKVIGGKVYAGGQFSTAGTVSASNIAVWNGQNWASLGSGVNQSVWVIAARGEDLFVGGSFTIAGGNAAQRIAKWNGSSWSGLNSNPIPSTVVSIDFAGDDMYVGSTSTTADNPNYLLKYDGTTWTGIFHGAGGHGVTSIAIAGTEVYASGGFQSIGGVSVQRVAKWNGTAWSALGSGLPGNSSLVHLAMSGDYLIAVGDFTTAGGNPANRAARWTGSQWIPLGNGLNGNTSEVIVAGGSIYAGGEFSTAGCNASPFFARWRETVWTGSANSDWHTATNWENGSVPATNSSISIISGDSSIVSADVTVSDLIIANDRTLTIGPGRTLTVTGDLDLSNGTINGAGTLIVNGGLQLNGNISGLAGVVVNGDLYLSGGTISAAVPVSVTSCRANAISGGSTASHIAGSLTRCVNGSGTFRFPVGVGGVYAPLDVSGITGSGSLTVTARSGQYSGAAAGLPANRLARYWDLANNGITQANFFIRYADQDIVGTEGRYRAYTIDSGTAQLVPTVLDRNANTATITGATSFSAITLAEGSATFETLNGRIRTASGRGAAYVLVSLTDGDGNVRYAVSNPNGYYRINNVEIWKTYTVSLQAKRFTFAQPQRTVEFVENAPAVNFTSTDN